MFATILQNSFLSWPSFGQRLLYLTGKNWHYDLNEDSHVYFWVDGGVLIYFFLSSQMTLTFQGHKFLKSHFWPYVDRLLLEQLSLNFNIGWHGSRPLSKLKYILNCLYVRLVRMRYFGNYFATIVLDHNF